jgi:peptidyl-prolyl cis-trans isomerase C
MLNLTKGGKMKHNILCIGVFIAGVWGYSYGEGKSVARVGDYTIDVAEFSKQYNPRKGADIDSLKKATLDKLIEEKLMLIDAYDKGYLEKVEPELEKFKNRLTVGKLYERAVVSKTKVSSWKVREWWWKLGTEIKFSQMIVKDKSKLKGIYKDLRKGKDFGEVALEHTKCTGCGKIRQVKWGELNPGLERVAFSLRPGDISHPIHSGNAWYILKVYERIKINKPDFVTEKEKIEGQLRGKKQAKLSSGYLEHLRKIAHPRYNVKVMEKLIESPADVPADAVLMSWVGGEFTADYFLKETAGGMSRGQFNTVESIKQWANNKLTYDILLPISAARHGLDRVPDIKEQLKEREQMLLTRRYQNEEIDGKIAVTDEECQEYYQEHKDNYKAEFERIKSRVEWDLKKEKKADRKEEVLNGLRNRVDIEVYEESLKEI